MRTKATLFLLVLVAGLGAVAYFVGQTSYFKTDKSPNIVFGPEAVNLDYIEVKFADQPSRVVLSRKQNGWQVTEPVRWPANYFAVNRIQTQLQFLERVNSFPVSSLQKNSGTLADYGLEPPDGVLIFGRGTTRHKVLLGKQTETNDRLYILPEGGDKIIVVSGTLREALHIDPDKLRSQSIFSLQPFEVRSWSLQFADTGNLPIFIQSVGPNWKIETPVDTRANKAAVETLLNKVLALNVTRFVPPSEVDLDRLGLTTPAFRIMVEGSSRREVLLIGAPAGTGEKNTEYYAKLEESPGQESSTVFTLNVDFIDQLRNAQLGLRERRVLEFNAEKLQSIQLAAAGQPEITLQKLENGAWQVGSRSTERGLVTMPGDPEVIKSLIQELQELQVVGTDGFVSDAAPDADLERYGLTGATAWQITLTESGATTRSQTLFLGATENSRKERPIYARLADKRYVYLVDRALADDLSVEPQHYRSLQILRLPDGPRVTALTITNLGRKKIAFTGTLAAPDQTWTQILATETPARRAAAGALLSDLRNLRARAIVAPEFSAFLPNDPEKRAWTWLLEAVVSTGSGTTQQDTPFSLYVDNYAGGGELLAAAPDPGVVFRADQKFIDAFTPLVFQRADPGPPQPEEPTAGAENPPQPAPETAPVH